MTTEKETLDKLHNLLHEVRRLKDYKPTSFESKVSIVLMSHFISSCEECKAVDVLSRIEKVKNPDAGFLGMFK
jgi:hypothetical protein